MKECESVRPQVVARGGEPPDRRPIGQADQAREGIGSAEPETTGVQLEIGQTRVPGQGPRKKKKSIKKMMMMTMIKEEDGDGDEECEEEE